MRWGDEGDSGRESEGEEEEEETRRILFALFLPPSLRSPGRFPLPSPTVNSSPQDSSWPTGEGRPIIITAALRDTFALVSAVRHTPRDGALMTLRRESVAP